MNEQSSERSYVAELEAAKAMYWYSRQINDLDEVDMPPWNEATRQKKAAWRETAREYIEHREG